MKLSFYLQVDIFMGLKGITSLDIVTSKILSRGHLYISWTDEHLTWNLTDYNGLSRLMIESQDIWTPRFVQESGMEIDYSLAQAWLHNNGKINLIIATSFEGVCFLDVRPYPFDKHECMFSLQPAALDTSEIRLLVRHLSNVSSLYSFSEHGEWEVIDSKTSIFPYIEPVSGTVFVAYSKTLILSRKYLFVLINTILPYSMFTVLNMVIYLIPVRSGERISFSITVLLAFIFFTSDISDELPHNSTQLSYVSIGMAALNIATSLGVVISVILCRLDYETTTPVPYVLQLMTIKYFKNLQRQDSNKQKVSSSSEPDSAEGNENFNDKSQSTSESDKTHSEAIEEIMWSHVVKMIDSVLFYINVVFLCLVSISGLTLVVNK